jgi:hypothetical protein
MGTCLPAKSRSVSPALATMDAHEYQRFATFGLDRLGISMDVYGNEIVGISRHLLQV